MGNMDGCDVALLVVAGYVALVTLVRLMIRRRDQATVELRRKMRKEKQREEAEQMQQKLRDRQAT